MNKIVFPSYEEIVKNNDLSVYKGYELEIPIVHNLCIVIDCQNENNIFKTGDPIICFKWCTKRSGFPIASVRYKNCEDGYYLGLKYLLDTAEDFKNAFSAVLEESELNENE